MNHLLIARAASLAIAFTLAPAALAQIPIPDETPGLPILEKDPNVRDRGEESDKPTNRLEWQRQAWGMVTPAFRSNALKEGARHLNKKNGPGPKWVNIGPTGADFAQNGSFTGHVRDSGRARTVLPHPTNARIVYLLTSGGGLWRTNNWASPDAEWQALTDDLPTTGGGSVAFGINPNNLYLGLGDPYDQILVGGAMVKSRNGGVTWDPIIELGNAVSVRDVKVDTTTGSDIVLVATDNGLFRSADQGLTYSPIAAFNGQSVWSIERTSAGWLASAQPCPAIAVGLFCGQATILYLSTDKGATWAPISNAGNIFNNNGRTTLGIGLPGDSVVYAYSSTITESALRDIYKSSDGGQTWVANGVNATKIPTNPVLGAMPNMNICQSQCWYNQMVLVDPRDPARNTVWIGGNLASAQSTNGGVTWTLKTWWLPSHVPTLPYAHADFHAGAFKLTGKPTIILGNDGGLNTSEDDGVTFSSDKNNGLVTHLYYTVSGNGKFPDLVIGGLQDNGTRLRIGNSTIHNQVIGGDGLGAAYSADSTNTVLGSSQGSGLRTNLSNTPPIVFQNWVGATAGLSDTAGAGFATAIVPAPTGLDPTGRVFFHFTASRVWRSNNGGLSWIRLASATAPTSTGLPAARRFRSSTHNLSVSPLDLNRIALGAAGGFLDITTDGGATWADLNLVSLVPGYQGFVNSVNWQDNQNIWITSVAQATGAIRVIKASIASPAASWATATFTVSQTGLPDLPVARVYFDPRDASRNTIYAATDVGIYSTTDGGANWNPYGNALPTVLVNDIYMPPNGSFMRIATYGRGIWEVSQLELLSAIVTGDTCDRDGILDNGESALLTLTLKNWGPNTVNHVSAELTSSNPLVTFPGGNLANLPPVQALNDRAGSIRIALNGATGIDTSDFTVKISAPELGLTGPLTVTSTKRLNYDDKAGVSAVETAESSLSGWNAIGSVSSPNILTWQRRPLSPLNTVWWGPNNNGQRDDQRPGLPDQQILLSPLLRVGSGPLSITFSHRFAFEPTGWDGGVIEASADGGATWTDIGTSAYNGSTNGITAAPIGASRPAFVNRLSSWPNFTPVVLNLGTAFANKDIRIRFRIGADESTGAPGWDVDDIQINGLLNMPFAGLIANAGACAK